MNKSKGKINNCETKSSKKIDSNANNHFLNNYYAEYSRCYIIKGMIIPKKAKKRTQ